jgi:hypothetical protein
MQSVTVLSTTTDSDGDGLSDGDELGAGTDPARVDSDVDGVGDGLEVRVGSDPTRAAAHVYYVSPEGDDAARGDSWAHAKADNAGLGVVPAGTSDAQPTFVLYAANAPAAASALWSLALAPPCDHIVLVGSLGSDALEPALDVVGAPTTTFALDGGTGLALEGCTNVRLLALAITGAGESAIRVSGGSVALDQVHLRENASSTQGGGLAATDAQIVVRSSVIAGNRADAGGGIAVDGGSLVIEHSTISGNAAQTAGGGISLVDTRADTRAYDSLVTVNGAAQGGGLSAHAGRRYGARQPHHCLQRGARPGWRRRPAFRRQRQRTRVSRTASFPAIVPLRTWPTACSACRRPCPISICSKNRARSP